MSKLNANHIIYIDGQPFKANEDGMWNLTEIWKTLELHRGKSPPSGGPKTLSVSLPSRKNAVRS